MWTRMPQKDSLWDYETYYRTDSFLESERFINDFCRNCTEIKCYGKAGAADCGHDIWSKSCPRSDSLKDIIDVACKASIEIEEIIADFGGFD